MSLVLAGVVLAWAGTVSASEAFDSATDLVEQISEQSSPTLSAYDGVDEPLDCPALIGGFRLASPPFFGMRRVTPPPAFSSILPRPTSPPPRRV